MSLKTSYRNCNSPSDYRSFQTSRQHPSVPTVFLCRSLLQRQPRTGTRQPQVPLGLLPTPVILLPLRLRTHATPRHRLKRSQHLPKGLTLLHHQAARLDLQSSPTLREPLVRWPFIPIPVTDLQAHPNSMLATHLTTMPCIPPKAFPVFPSRLR